MQPIAVESIEEHATADNLVDGKGEALVDNLPSMETKNTYSMEEHSVSSAFCGDNKQQPSLGIHNAGSKLVSQSQQAVENVPHMDAEEEISNQPSVSSDKDGKKKQEESVSQSQQAVQNVPDMDAEEEISKERSDSSDKDGKKK